MTTKPTNPFAILDKAIEERSHQKYVLCLYISGITPRSTTAIERVKRVCEEHLRGRYDLEIVDIYQQPTLARGAQIIAAPTLLRKQPLPLRRIIGDMSNESRLLFGLDLQPRKILP